MIEYVEAENKYLYKQEDIDKILGKIKAIYNEGNITQENITLLVESINDFKNHMTVIQENVTKERHETEDEARKYFGEEFISKFDQLLTILDMEETIVAIHGTSEELCPTICENGLQYKTPSLSSTAVQQTMAYGQHEMHYDDYENLLNWKHKNYKGLVILAIPYECYYKEGIWKQFKETNSSFYGGQDYRIDPDFIVGYIDVNKKQIVMNSKYNRQHNYEGYVRDIALFKENPNMDNNKYRQLLITTDAQIKQQLSQHKENKQEGMEEQIDISQIPGIIDDFRGIFNSIKVGSPDGMSERIYEIFLKELSYEFNYLIKTIPLLKTNEQLRKEQSNSILIDNIQSASSIDEETDFDDLDWEDSTGWEIPEEETIGKIL
jgi:hypothetical protein